MKAPALSVSRLSVSVMVVMFAVLSLIIVRPAEAGFSVVIADDATGGDCSLVGQWNAGDRTCRLDNDLSIPGDGGIYIADDGITLQCDGHAITGSWKGTGIYLYGRSDVTVRSCTVKNFVYGIYLYVSGRNFVQENVTDPNYWGIVLYDSNSNTVNNNNADYNAYTGIVISNADFNTVNHNTTYANGYGIDVYRSDSNTLVNNAADDNSYYGFVDESGADNKFNRNECSGNGTAGSYPAGLCSP